MTDMFGVGDGTASTSGNVAAFTGTPPIWTMPGSEISGGVHLADLGGSSPIVASHTSRNTFNNTAMVTRPDAFGSEFRSAVDDMVIRICGLESDIEPDEELLGIYFAWQEPQHMPVDEALFRRKTFVLQGLWLIFKAI
jgi:hypothetical protein